MQSIGESFEGMLARKCGHDLFSTFFCDSYSFEGVLVSCVVEQDIEEDRISELSRKLQERDFGLTGQEGNRWG
jgi:hypothetical protein